MIENPMIAEMERHLSEQESAPQCPVCGEYCETVFVNDDNYLAGCEHCILDSFTAVDSWDWWAREKEGRAMDEGDRRYHQMKEGGF